MYPQLRWVDSQIHELFASGIGFGMVRAFLSEGMKVVLADWSAPNLEKAKAALAGNNAVAFVRANVADRADLMVWLDLPRATVMRQVTARTLRRRLTRQELWNGNVEPPLRTILTAKQVEALGDRMEEDEQKVLGHEGFEKAVDQVAALEKRLGIYELKQFTP